MECSCMRHALPCPMHSRQQQHTDHQMCQAPTSAAHPAYKHSSSQPAKRRAIQLIPPRVQKLRKWDWRSIQKTEAPRLQQKELHVSSSYEYECNTNFGNKLGKKTTLISGINSGRKRKIPDKIRGFGRGNCPTDSVLDITKFSCISFRFRIFL